MMKKSFLSAWRAGEREALTPYQKRVVRKFLREKEKTGRRITLLEKLRAGYKVKRTAYSDRVRREWQKSSAWTRLPLRIYDSKRIGVRFYEYTLPTASIDAIIKLIQTKNPHPRVKIFFIRGNFINRDGMEGTFQTENIPLFEAKTPEIIRRRIEAKIDPYNVDRLINFKVVLLERI